MEKIRTIIGKEWSEVFRNRLVLFTVLFMPLLFVALPLISLATMAGLGTESLNTGAGGDLGFGDLNCAGLSDGECAQVYMLVHC